MKNYNYKYKDKQPVHKLIKELKGKVKDDELRYELITNSLLLGSYNAKINLGERYFGTQISRSSEEWVYLSSSLEETLKNLDDPKNFNDTLKKDLAKLIAGNYITDKDLNNNGLGSIYIFIRKILKEKEDSSILIGKAAERVFLQPYGGKKLNKDYYKEFNSLKNSSSDLESALEVLNAKYFHLEQSRLYNKLKEILYGVD